MKVDFVVVVVVVCDETLYIVRVKHKNQLDWLIFFDDLAEKSLAFKSAWVSRIPSLNATFVSQWSGRILTIVLGAWCKMNRIFIMKLKFNCYHIWSSFNAIKVFF